MLGWEVYSNAFNIQWHITAKCDGNCKHCYVTDEKTYRRELENELSYEELIGISDRIKEFRDKYRTNVSVSITGGHPLLRKEYREIIEVLKKDNITTRILGNASHLDSEIDFLKLSELEEYQLSLDGTKEIHDDIRGEGSWDKTMAGIDVLKRNNLKVGIMCTVNCDNMSYLKDLYDVCSDKRVDRFSFDRVVAIGNASDMKLPGSREYKRFLYDTYQHAVSKERRVPLALKDQLFKPLMNEMGIFKPRKVDRIISGCPVGVSGISVLSDGTVYPCRRLPIEIGKLPEQSIEEIFFESTEMEELRNYESIEDCGECDLLSYCRGNRCVALASNDDYFAPDPQCWRCDE